MDEFFFLSLMVVAFLLIVGIPIGMSYLIYWWIKKRNFDKRLRLIALMPVILIGYTIYDSIYPSDEFYEEDYKEVTNQEFPKSGKVVIKSASFPDHFGDYTSSALVELDSNEYYSLQIKLAEDDFVVDSTEFSTSERIYVEKKLNGRFYTKQMSKELDEGKYYSVGFLSDGKSIVYQRVSW